MFNHLAVRAATITALTFALSGLGGGSAHAAPAGPGPGNSPNAKQCYKGGWQNLVDANAVAFAGQDACVAYAAKGGVLSPKPTATLVIEFGMCTTTNDSSILSCPAFSVTGSGLKAGADVVVCDTIQNVCGVPGVVEADGTLPDEWASNSNAGCFVGDVVTVTTLTAAGTKISDSGTCTLTE